MVVLNTYVLIDVALNALTVTVCIRLSEFARYRCAFDSPPSTTDSRTECLSRLETSRLFGLCVVVG